MEWQFSRHYFPLLWLLIVSFAGFALYVTWDTALVGLVFWHDRSHITLLISGLALGASGHAAWHILLYSDRIDALLQRLNPEPTPQHGQDHGPEQESGDRLSVERTGARFASSLLEDLTRQPTARDSPAEPGRPLDSSEREAMLELHADRLRSPVELGWFIVDLAVRLGLVGTIIGFILIFTSLSDTDVRAAEGISELLVAMSGGMGTALFTTLTGLIAASLLSLQYLVLGRATETLLGLMIRLQAHRDALAGPDTLPTGPATAAQAAAPGTVALATPPGPAYRDPWPEP